MANTKRAPKRSELYDLIDRICAISTADTLIATEILLHKILEGEIYAREYMRSLHDHDGPKPRERQ